MRTTLTAALTLSLVLLAGCSPPMNWTPYTSAEGNFTVSFPGPTQEKSQSAGPMTLKAVACERPEGAYMVMFAKLPADVFDLDAGVKALAGSSEGTNLTAADVTVPGGRGKSFQMQIKKPKAGWASGKFIVVNQTLYQVIVAGTNAKADNPDVKKFLDSFQVTAK